jgi:predicted nucleic acid-binding protein
MGEPQVRPYEKYRFASELPYLYSSLTLKAARISSGLGLPLADSVILATARTCAGVIWTQDPHFKGLEGSDTWKRANRRIYGFSKDNLGT